MAYSIDGPLGLRRPVPLTAWDAFAVKPSDFTDAELGEANRLAAETVAERERREVAEREAYAQERLLTDTRENIDALFASLQEKFQSRNLTGLDELLDKITACDSFAAGEQLQPYEYQLRFVGDAKERLEARIRTARLRRLEATFELRKVEALEASLLAVISHGRTAAALGPIIAEEGAVGLIGKRTETLRAIAREKQRQVVLAEDELAAERNRQIAAEQVKLARVFVTTAQVESAIHPK